MPYLYEKVKNVYPVQEKTNVARVQTFIYETSAVISKFGHHTFRGTI